MTVIKVGWMEVDATKCDHTEGGENATHCIHDWRIAGPVGAKNLDGSAPEFWGNVEKTGNAQSDLI